MPSIRSANSAEEAKLPGFTFLAVLCLGLGIGVNASIFSVLNSLFLRPLPVTAPDRLVVSSAVRDSALEYLSLIPIFGDFRDRTGTLTGMTASLPTESSLDFDGLAHSAGAEAVSPDYPAVIGIRPFLGHWFQTEDEDSCVISYIALGSGSSPLTRTSSANEIRSETQWYDGRHGASRPRSSKEFICRSATGSVGTFAPLDQARHPGFDARMEDRGQPHGPHFWASGNPGSRLAKLPPKSTRSRPSSPRIETKPPSIGFWSRSVESPLPTLAEAPRQWLHC